MQQQSYSEHKIVLFCLFEYTKNAALFQTPAGTEALDFECNSSWNLYIHGFLTNSNKLIILSEIVA